MPLFVIPEFALVDGLLPESAVAPMQAWFTHLATDAGQRRAIARYTTASVDEGLRDGTLLRGAALTRWRELIGAGGLLTTLQTWVGRLRDWMGVAINAAPVPGAELAEALGHGRSSHPF